MILTPALTGTNPPTHTYNETIVLIMDIICYSYLLWERVVGGQVQGPPCSTAANPILSFITDVMTELVTVPLNLTNVR